MVKVLREVDLPVTTPAGRGYTVDHQETLSRRAHFWHSRNKTRTECFKFWQMRPGLNVYLVTCESTDVFTQ